MTMSPSVCITRQLVPDPDLFTNCCLTVLYLRLAVNCYS